MLLGGGRFAIANQKDGQGGWEWRTFGDGAGFTADEITTGKLTASVVQIGPETTYEPVEEFTLERYQDMTLQEIIDTYGPGGDE